MELSDAQRGDFERPVTGPVSGARERQCACGHPLDNHWRTGKRLCMACPDGECADFTPAAPGARERLAAEFVSLGLTPGEGYYADALLPVVESLADERAAEALEEAMREDRTTVSKLSPVERLTCFLVKGEDLLARASALRASHGETGR